MTTSGLQQRRGPLSSADGTRARSRVHVPDETLLRRFGIVRAVGGGAYILGVIVIAAIYGWDTWPLILGVPILAVATVAYFQRSQAYPRAAVIATLLADTVVLGGAGAFVGGSGSGTAALYVIPIVSGGIILGPAAAIGFTALAVTFAWLQLVSEETLFTPFALHREALDERVVVLLIMSTVLISVGYLTGTYASRLQDNIAEADEAADEVRRRTRRRRSFVTRSTVKVRGPLEEVERVADTLDHEGDLAPAQRRALAASLRMRTTQLEAEISRLADVGIMDSTREERPEPVLLSRVVADCLHELGDALDQHEVHVDVPPLRVVGDRRAARRIAYNLLENVAEHTPAGTRVWIEGRTTGGQGVLVVTDDGPGVPSNVAHRLFAAPDEGGGMRVGMPLVKELADAMGAEITYEPRDAGGSIFLVGFRLAPRDTPTPDDED